MARLDGFFWVLTIVLAIVLLVMGFVLVRTSPGGRQRLGWAENIPRGVAVFAGIAMIVGALCLVVPALIPGLAWLTPLGAALMAALMFGIAQTYLTKRDSEGAAVYILLLVMLAALAYARWSWLGVHLG